MHLKVLGALLLFLHFIIKILPALFQRFHEGGTRLSLDIIDVPAGQRCPVPILLPERRRGLHSNQVKLRTQDVNSLGATQPRVPRQNVGLAE